jgi:hypothetical protein
MASTEALTRTVETLTEKPFSVTLPSGRAVEVQVCKTRHLPILLRLLALVFEPLNIKLSQKPKPGEIASMLDNLSFVLNIVATNLPVVLEAARSLTPLKPDEIDDLDIDDLVALLDAIIRRNYDFFTQRLLPALEKYLPAEVKKLVAGESQPEENSTPDSSTQ